MPPLAREAWAVSVWSLGGAGVGARWLARLPACLPACLLDLLASALLRGMSLDQQQAGSKRKVGSAPFVPTLALTTHPGPLSLLPACVPACRPAGLLACSAVGRPPRRRRPMPMAPLPADDDVDHNRARRKQARSARCLAGLPCRLTSTTLASACHRPPRFRLKPSLAAPRSALPRPP
ncbi:uncharacterized protein PSFLO_02168 [Pseudozyma flocculosa]|uniref:Uncharacterized protein n=1 Tax=Pseudozyma flocculosa TaxID=84751 RepID=A0A5C3EZ47_9BASI|nr:uncharacterized protein PSFLO_02168 [Pseudozyma flocculosa]